LVKECAVRHNILVEKLENAITSYDNRRKNSILGKTFGWRFEDSQNYAGKALQQWVKTEILSTKFNVPV